MEAVLVRPIAASETHDLRRSVLRNGDPSALVSWPEDDRPTAFHLGVSDGDEVAGVASFSEEPLPVRPGEHAWRLRGMAVIDSHQGRGLGRALLDDAVRRLRAMGATVLWCNARDTAMKFYADNGFVVVGDGFNTDETGLPHHVMVLDL